MCCFFTSLIYSVYLIRLLVSFIWFVIRDADFFRLFIWFIWFVYLFRVDKSVICFVYVLRPCIVWGRHTQNVTKWVSRVFQHWKPEATTRKAKKPPTPIQKKVPESTSVLIKRSNRFKVIKRRNERATRTGTKALGVLLDSIITVWAMGLDKTLNLGVATSSQQLAQDLLSVSSAGAQRTWKFALSKDGPTI